MATTTMMAGAGAAPVWLVVPCYDEERRLSLDRFALLLQQPQVRLLFVDDGSRDGTYQALCAFARRDPRRIEVLRLAANRGKGEAVRTGLLRALAAGAGIVGYLDADLSTPPEEVLRLLGIIEAGGPVVVLGSRVRMLGTAIERRALAHYRGRVFATGASLALGLPVYDTQCGAKLFRNVPALFSALSEPFRTRWAFDVELLGRLVTRGDGTELHATDIVEVPLRRWVDVGGSKLGAWQMVRAAADLVRIAFAQRRARAGQP